MVIIGLSVTLLFIHIFNVMDACERIGVGNITYSFHLPVFLPAPFLCLSSLPHPPKFFFFFKYIILVSLIASYLILGMLFALDLAFHLLLLG